METLEPKYEPVIVTIKYPYVRVYGQYNKARDIIES